MSRDRVSSKEYRRQVQQERRTQGRAALLLGLVLLLVIYWRAAKTPMLPSGWWHRW